MDSGLTIVLLGNAGVGKSASGNTILGQAAFESKPSFKPVTTRICEATGQVFGKQISVIDTPGILGSEELIKILCQELQQASRPHLFLVVFSIRRFSEGNQEAVEAAVRVLGPQSLRKSYLLFTGGDALNDIPLDDFILEDDGGPLQNAVKRFEGRHHLFNNQHGGQEQVQELLKKSGHIQPLQHLSASPASCLFEPVSQLERRVVLLGRPGGGKSSSGNTILGSKKFKSDCDFKLVSTEIVSKSAEVEGRQVTVVDTPGFTDAVLTPEELYKEIMKTLVKASPGPHAFVIVVKIGKIITEDIKLFEMLPVLFGSDASKYTIVLFTGGDELRGHSIDQMIQSNKSVFELVSMCGGRYSVFNNTQRGSRKQVREFLNQIDEMVAASGGKHCISEMCQPKPTWKKRVCKILMPFLLAVLVGGVVGGVVGVMAGVKTGGVLGAVAGVLFGAFVYKMTPDE